jgi:hypothetical protein
VIPHLGNRSLTPLFGLFGLLVNLVGIGLGLGLGARVVRRHFLVPDPRRIGLEHAFRPLFQFRMQHRSVTK